ncbi:MAG: RNA methyltransferase [Bacteroidota bacterium]|nr:RNA methyltransferase [Bacteroidota bacterium]
MLTKKIVKYIQSLSHKKFRDEEGCFIAEGPKIVSEFLGSEKFICKIICAEKDWLFENKILLINISPENIFEIDEHWIERISLLKTPNKVLAVFNKPGFSNEIILQNKISLMLDDIQDPGNLGTIIRNADWFGIENIICSGNCVDCYNPKVVQSTMGSLLRVNVLYNDLISFIKKNNSINIYAAALSGISVYEIGKINEGIILIGNESKGIHEDILKVAGNRITIPRFGHAESLNAAVASGIILAEIRNPIK